MPRLKIDVAGQRFGKLLVLREVAGIKSNGGRKLLWECLCDCGNLHRVTGTHLRSGAVVSCGCHHAQRQKEVPKTHGYSKTPVHLSWMNMRQRCNNPNNTAYANYGGRGIAICDRWETFEGFIEDMGEPPEGTTLDRIDVNGPYCKENCRWATKRTQSTNKRTNRVLEFQERSMTLVEWAEEIGIPYYTLHSRLRQGWSAEKTLTVPVRRSSKTTTPSCAAR